MKKAQLNLKKAGLENRIQLRKLDYHRLDSFEESSFDGIYTMETFVHATDPQRALQEFFRVLRPGGRIALYEYDHKPRAESPADLQTSLDHVNLFAAMPANAVFDEGVLEDMLQEVGFSDVNVIDLSVNIRPMLRLFYVIAFIPYFIICLLGLQAWFVNTIAGYESYRGRKYWRYIAVFANKPGHS